MNSHLANGGGTRVHVDHNEDATASSLGIYEASSVAEIQASLAQLSQREASVTSRLDDLIASQRDLTRELGRLDLLRAQIGSQAVTTRSVSNGILSSAASTATRISGAVKRLDLEQARVRSTLDVVDQVAELKACVLGVTGSMGAPQDWETAAGYLHRASKIPKDIVNGSFAEEIVPTAEVPDPPRVTLDNAAESLRGLFLREFEKAAQEGNGGKVTRFFKLFPLIGKPDVGLDVYGRYVCQGVASRARIIEHHGGLVERHYGAGRMTRVIERLQLEADVQGGIIIDTWCDERSVDRKLTDIRSYAFTFLVQSFLPVQPARGGTPRAGSPAKRGSAAEVQTREDDGIDMKSVDGILSEIAMMLVEKAFQLDEQPTDLSLNPKQALSSNPPYITSAVDDVMYIVNQVVERSLATSQKAVIQSVIPTLARVLGSDFIGMIQRKMRDESYPKATIQGAPPAEQTIIAFLVLINNLDIATDYVERIVQSRIEATSGVASPNGAGQGLAESIMTLFPLGNDAVIVANALKSLQNTFEGKTSELIGDGIIVVFKNVVKPRLRPILADAFRDVDYQMTREEIEELKREAEADDGDVTSPENVVQYQFQRGWDLLTQPVIRILTSRNYERLLATIISYLGEVLEKRIWSYYGRLDDLGAVRLERDVASIVGIVVRGGRYGLRDAFARCTQICLVMNMEVDEWEELQAASSGSRDEGLEWKIDDEERARARAMVKDRR
ncbi:conserved oligomeric Golgi complex subunit 4, partial [Lecanoromycetidae sp. Uapishka_2]